MKRRINRPSLFEMILAELGLATCQEPLSMGAAGNRGGEIHDPSPGDIASVSMVKVWPTLKDPEGRHIPEPGGDKGPNNQVGMTKHVIPPGSRKKNGNPMRYKSGTNP